MGRFDEETYCYLSVKEYFADLINAGCFGGRRVVRAEELEHLSERMQEDETKGDSSKSGVIKGKRSIYRDVRMKMRWGSSFLLLAVENQEKVDWEMPLRIMRYDVAEYKKQVDEIYEKKRKQREAAGLKRSRIAERMGENDKLKPIYTICFYHGSGEWNGPRSLKDVMDFGEDAGDWKERFGNYPITVINAEDEKVADNCRTQVKQFLDVMRARKNRKHLKELLQNKAYENLSYETARIIAVMANLPNFLECEEAYKNQESEGYNVCQAMEEIKEEYKAEGRSEGRTEGRAAAIIFLLQEKGEVSQGVKDEIFAEKDTNALNKMLSLAARVNDPEQFRRQYKEVMTS